MTAQHTIERRRARPLLGTLVEITARGASECEVMRGIDRGFAAITRVHRLMSFHERHSNVGRLNRHAWRAAIRVHPWTWSVLQAAQRLASRSRGLFDVTIAQELVRLNYLPRSNGQRPHRNATWRDMALLPGHRVRFRRPLNIDLGGIAKGYAVDQAVAAMRRSGVSSGLVNAGGDLRSFGSVVRRIHLRHPAHPDALIPCIDLSSGALATSASYFARRSWRGRSVSPMIDAVRRRAIDATFSATVVAPTCMLADALTKLLLLRGERASGTIRRLGGRALIVRGSGVTNDLQKAA